MSELIDRQALLDECLNHYEVGNIEQNCTMDWICKTVRNFHAASTWHRVEERLPNVGELVVGLDADGHAEITMLSEAKCWLTYGLWIHNLDCYVWWMPLPEPPKEE